MIMVDGLTVVERETEWAVEVAGPDMYSPPRVLQCADENDARTYQRVFGGHLKSRERYVTDWASAS